MVVQHRGNGRAVQVQQGFNFPGGEINAHGLLPGDDFGEGNGGYAKPACRTGGVQLFKR